MRRGNALTIAISAKTRLMNVTTVSVTRKGTKSPDLDKKSDASCDSRLPPCRMYIMSSLTQVMLAWIVTRTHIAVMRTAGPIRGLSHPRDTEHVENRRIWSSEARTSQIERNKVNTGVNSITQDIEEIEMEYSCKFIHHMFVC